MTNLRRQIPLSGYGFQRIGAIIVALLLCVLTSRGQEIPAAQPDSVAVIVNDELVARQDTIAVIVNDELVGDELYGDTIVALSQASESTAFARPYDSTHDFHWEQFAIPGAVMTAGALFVRTPALVRARHWVQDQLANKTGSTRTTADNYLQYAPLVASYGIYFCGLRGEHNLLDRTLIVAMSYATFAVLNNGMKFAFSEKRPDTNARNSFPSGHTGTAFVGAEFLRREYWSTNKWIGIAGYACAGVVAYLRVYNNRHWINDVVAGAAVGYISTAFAYWLYPRIFRKRARIHTSPLIQPLESSPTASRTSGGRSGSPKVICIAAPYATSHEAGLACSLTF